MPEKVSAKLVVLIALLVLGIGLLYPHALRQVAGAAPGTDPAAAPEQSAPTASRSLTATESLWGAVLLLVPLGLGLVLGATLARRAAPPERAGAAAAKAEAKDEAKTDCDGTAPAGDAERHQAPDNGNVSATSAQARVAHLEHSLRRRDNRIRQLKKRLHNAKDAFELLRVAHQTTGAMPAAMPSATGPDPDLDELDRDALRALAQKWGAELEARQSVIESLESLLSENQNRWVDYELTDSEKDRKIARLEADLAASAIVIGTLEDELEEWIRRGDDGRTEERRKNLAAALRR